MAVAGLPPGLERVQQILHPQMWSCSTQQNLGHYSRALCQDVRILSELFWSSIVCPFFSEKLKSIQLVLGEYDMYNYREEFPEHTAKIRRKIIHPKVVLFEFLGDKIVSFVYSLSLCL